MRIIQVTDLYPPHVGGTERHVQKLARELARRGHEVMVATLVAPGSDLPLREVEAENLTVVRIPSSWAAKLPGAFEDPERTFHVPMLDPGVVAALRSLIVEFSPEVAHTHNWMKYSFLAARVGFDVPVLDVLHDYGLVCHKRTFQRFGAPSCDGPSLRTCADCGSEQYGWAKSLGLAAMLRAARTLNSGLDEVIAVSQAVADASAPGWGRPIGVVPTFLADGLAERFAAAPRPSFVPDGEYLLYVGALGEFKGVGVLLDSYERLRATRPDVPPLVVVGTPKPDMPTVWPEGVTVVQSVPHDEVMAAWRHALLGVVPSVWGEPWGQVAAEAATMGRPVVATRVGGLQDVVDDGVTGLLVPPGDAAALAAGIGRLLDDPVLRERLGAAGAIRAEGFTVSNVTDRLERIFAALAAGGRATVGAVLAGTLTA